MLATDDLLIRPIIKLEEMYSNLGFNICMVNLETDEVYCKQRIEITDEWYLKSEDK